MYLPGQNNLSQFRTQVDTFGGLNRRDRAREGEFADMANLSCDGWPLIQTRKRRTTVKQFAAGETVTGFADKGALIFTVQSSGANRLFINNREISGVTLRAGEKTIVGMGCYAVIFPDGYYINVFDTQDRGALGQTTEISATALVPLTLTPCTFDGESLTAANTGATAPQNPANGQIWLDTSGSSAIYKIWDANSGMWQQVSTVYVKLTYAGIGEGFAQWDGVRVHGLLGTDTDETVNAQVSALNAEGVLLQGRDTDWLLMAGMLNKQVTVTGTVTIERKVPEMDFVTESGNRLWGCHVGVANGKTVNEIYACRQGDFKNWFAYAGVSTDSYAMSLGTDGVFTGAITYLNTPVFFKENYIHKIYGETPASYSLSVTSTQGVGRGMEHSIVTDGRNVFYRGTDDFCAWGGAYPTEIGEKLGELRPQRVVAGCTGHKLYFYTQTQDAHFLLIFDTQRRLWHKESCDTVKAFVRSGQVLYMLAQGEDGRFRIDSADDRFDTLLLDENSEAVSENAFDWSAETGDSPATDIFARYLQRVTLHVKAEEGTVLSAQIRYDGGDWEDCFETTAEEGSQLVQKSVLLHRCGTFRLRLQGTGGCKLLLLEKKWVQGSDKA